MKTQISWTMALITAFALGGCDKHEGQSRKPAEAKEISLVEIAVKDSQGRITKDAQGNVVEIDFRGIPLSDAFVRKLLEPELKWLQKFSVSGQMITDQTITSLSSSAPFPIYREIVFEDTSIQDPEGHPWVKSYREAHSGTKLTFKEIESQK